MLIALSVGVATSAGGRAALLWGAVGGTAAFDFFDTSPYGNLLITRTRDVVTAVVLLVAGLLVGELCARLSVYRHIAAERESGFAVMQAAAGLMAYGEDAAVVIEALAGELQTRLGLSDCQFVFGPLPLVGRRVARDGLLVGVGAAGGEYGDRDAGPRWVAGEKVGLAVGLGTETVGYYRMIFGAVEPSRERLLVAVGVADQAGAALAAARPDESPVSGSMRSRRLRSLAPTKAHTPD